MGITGISLSETKDYISVLDRGEQKTIWKLAALESDIFNLVCGYGNILQTGSDAVRFGLRGFENFKDANGNEVRFNTVSRAIGQYTYKVVADNIMKIIPPNVIFELGTEILKLSKLNEEEIKN